MYLKMNENALHNNSRLTLEKRHQLIDLNKEYVNFDITFECKAVDATKDFEIIVVNQEQLNTIDLTNLMMKRTKGGYISGNIIADEDKYQNYFLIVRSATEEPVDVDLDIKIKPIEPKQPSDFPQQPVSPSPSSSSTPTQPILMDDEIICSQSSSGMGRKQIFFIVLGLLIIGGAVGYYFWKKRRQQNATICSMEDDVRSVYSESSSGSKSSSSSVEEAGILDTLLHKSKAKTASS